MPISRDRLLGLYPDVCIRVELRCSPQQLDRTGRSAVSLDAKYAESPASTSPIGVQIFLIFLKVMGASVCHCWLTHRSSGL